MAVSAGHLVLFSEWSTPSTSIHLELSGERFESRVKLFYESEALSRAAQAAEDREALDGL
jgi:hypothetical protein